MELDLDECLDQAANHLEKWSEFLEEDANLTTAPELWDQVRGACGVLEMPLEGKVPECPHHRRALMVGAALVGLHLSSVQLDQRGLKSALDVMVSGIRSRAR